MINIIQKRLCDREWALGQIGIAFSLRLEGTADGTKLGELAEIWKFETSFHDL